jgi:hypothetical protein
VVAGDIPLGPIMPEAKDVFFNQAWPEATLVFIRDVRGAVACARILRYPSWLARARKVE